MNMNSMSIISKTIVKYIHADKMNSTRFDSSIIKERKKQQRTKQKMNKK